jgi:ParB/RepB/Spo0J family partition protein
MSNNTATATGNKAATKGASKATAAEPAAPPKAATKNETTILARAKIMVDPRSNARGFGKPIDTSADSFKELCESIRETGLLEPLVVRKHDNGSYSLLAGFRRIAACDAVGLTEIPVTVKVGDEVEAMVVGLLENVQRDDLTPAEIAYACVAMKKAGKSVGVKLTNEEIAGKLHKSRSHIGNLIRCAENLPDVVAKAFRGESGVMLKLETAIKIAGMTDKEGKPDRDRQMEEWEKVLGRANKGEGGEEEDEKGGTGEAKPPRMPRREKIEKLMDELSGKDLESVLIGGSWQDPTDDVRKALRSCLRWVLNSAAKYPVKVVEPEEEEEEEEGD